MCIDRYVAESEQRLKKAPAMKEYVGCELQAICDVLNVVTGCAASGSETAGWLKMAIPGKLYRHLRVQIAWCEDSQEFQPVK